MSEVAYLTLRQLAARWQVSSNTLRRMMDRGDFAYVKIGHGVRIPVNEVERYERDRMARGGAE